LQEAESSCKHSPTLVVEEVLSGEQEREGEEEEACVVQ